MNPSVSDRFEAIIVGAGMAGVAAAARLLKEHKKVLVLEESDSLGGVWQHNRYPGAAADTPAHLYQYSFDLNPFWSHTYASADEICDYLLAVAESHGVTEHTRLKTRMVRAEFADDGMWLVQARHRQGQVDYLLAETLILANGWKSIPHMPDLPGQDNFSGKIWHSAQWPAQADVFGKNIGILGDDPAAVQLIPYLAQDAHSLTVFQTEAPWVLPRNNKPYTEAIIDQFAARPSLLKLHRRQLRLEADATAAAYSHRPGLLRLRERQARRHLHSQVSAEDLRTQLAPTVPFPVATPVRSDDYYPALQSPQVELVRQPVTRMHENGVVLGADAASGGVDGERRDLDALILATGFTHNPYEEMTVLGREGCALADVGPVFPAYLGMSLEAFPNMFLLLGPRTQTPHSNSLLFLEAQLQHLIAVLAEKQRRQKTIARIRPEVAAGFNTEMKRRLEQQQAPPDNGALWPGTGTEFERRLRTFHAVDYVFM